MCLHLGTSIYQLGACDFSIFHSLSNDNIQNSNDDNDTCLTWLLGEFNEVTHRLDSVHRRDNS